MEPGRWEYITSTGSAAQNAVNLMYGPGSLGTSVTVTPTFQHGGLFFRGDISYVYASTTPRALSLVPRDSTKTRPGL